MHGIGRRGRRRASGRCTAIASSDPTALLGQSDAATAMKTAELEHQFSLTEKFEAQAWTKAGTGAALLAEAKNHCTPIKCRANYNLGAARSSKAELEKFEACTRCDDCG